MLMLLRSCWQRVIHLLTEEQGSTMPNGFILNSWALGSISHWMVFVSLFKLISSFFRRPFTNTFTNHRTIHIPWMQFTWHSSSWTGLDSWTAEAVLGLPFSCFLALWHQKLIFKEDEKFTCGHSGPAVPSPLYWNGPCVFNDTARTCSA